MHVGDGISPVTWQELDRWAVRTLTDLTWWEAVALRGLSVAFAREAVLAKDPNREAPWKASEIDRIAVSDGIEQAFMRFNKNRKAKKR